MHSSEDKSITEQFTISGFLTICLVAVYLGVLFLPVLGLLEVIGLNLDNYKTWEYWLLLYACSWLISFWMFCLSPKLKD
ncbi:MAG: hypothetical protein Sapg2KO_07210 [Saprospiraceae bacterium]